MEIGLLIIRVVLGLTLAAHGAQKLFAWFGGYGISGTGGFIESMGFRPGRVFATLAGLGEFAGGLGFALGLLTPFATAGIIATMLVAIISAHLSKGFFNTGGGYEYPLALIAAALGVAFTGPGRFSLDAALGFHLAGTTWGLVALGLGGIGAAGSLLSRSPAPQAAQRQAGASA